MLAASVWGVSVPWTLALATALGIVLMATPGMFGGEQPGSAVFHLGGSLLVVVAVVAMGEVLRAGRPLAVPLGLGIAVLPWVLEGAPLARVLGTVLGLATLPRGTVRERYGAWDRLVR